MRERSSQHDRIIRPAVHADLRNKHYREWGEFLKQAEGWDKQQISDYQLEQLKGIVRYAYENTKAYRSLYDHAGITPDSITTLDDIERLPFVEKEMIRDHLEDFSVDIKGRAYVTTGGSTGIPFGFYRDRRAFARELASKAYQYSRIGWKEGDRQLVLRGLPIKSKNHMRYFPRFNELRCSSYYLVPEVLEVYRQRAFDYAPGWIKCYPSSGYIFARFLRETGRPFPAIKGVLCASENLYGFQRELMSEAFGARVFSHYGHYELAVLAGFCEQEDTYHVLPQYGYAELIDQEGQIVTEAGRVGEIVGSSFIMRATPFIRYRTRDLAVLKGWECASCGRPFQVWERIEGRSQEFIVTASGRRISMAAVNMHDDIFNHLKQIRFFQAEKGRVKFKFVPKDSCSDEIIRAMRSRLLAKLGDGVALEMEAVEEIPPTPRGKHGFLDQRLTVPFGMSQG